MDDVGVGHVPPERRGHQRQRRGPLEARLQAGACRDLLRGRVGVRARVRVTVRLRVRHRVLGVT